MFHRFGLPTERVEDGSGIGLAVSERLVQKMAGRIGFESEEGVGSTFWIELPLASTAATFA